MLTERARQYLTSLERLRPVPTKEVERVLGEQGSPCFEVWLDFHERYAGYVEPLGGDQATWGIVHEGSRWMKPGQANVKKAHEVDVKWFVTCAAVHGSYTYELGDTGMFRERSAESFDIKVERNAARVTFMREAVDRPRLWTKLDDPAFLERVRRETTVVAEASDRFYRVLMGESLCVVEDAQTREIVEALTRGHRP